MKTTGSLAGPEAVKTLAGVIDHTLLKPEATREQIEELCTEARRYGFASVCVNPAYIKLASQSLRGSPIKVCSVVGFPLGAALPEVKAYEAEMAIRDGAREIDMVMNIGALKSRDYALVKKDIEAVVEACHRQGAIVKVIIEAPLLTDEEKAKACELAMGTHADYVKTATGFGSGGATVHDVALMRRTVGETMGVKAAGGIHSFEEVKAMIEAGATRIGASAGVKIVEELKEGLTRQAIS
ncbi:MAG: deoxyribose-phosphate aldolase [Chloroflexota bacterium]|nr:deoxyribose-phosphate aldolase [Chloroflexota bacterium]